MKVLKINVTDMDCAMCAKSIENAFEGEAGIVSANVNLSEGYARVKYDEMRWNENSIAQRIRAAGYTPKLIKEKKKFDYFVFKIIVSVILTVPLFWTMLAHSGLGEYLVPSLFMNPFFQWALATPVQFWIGATYYKRSFYDLKNKTIGMGLLVAVSTTVAYFYSVYLIFANLESILAMGHYDGLLYFEASSVIITIILIGHYLEHKVKKRTSKALQELMELSVKEAIVLENGKEILKPLDAVFPGDVVLVRKGEKIPLDGEITEGETLIDESMITGESLPVKRAVGQDTIGSTINLGSTVKIKVTKPLHDTMLQQIINAVEDAQAKKPKIQRIADLIAGIFVPTVIVISLVSFFVNFYWLRNGDFDASFSAAIAVMVISCPCALGLATPMSIMVGSSLSARHGILYRSGEVFEKTKTITAVAFDKTGTLTKGQPAVTDVIGDGFDILLGLEESSTHPLSIAIREYAKAHGIESVRFTDIKEEAGKGLSVTQGNKTYYAGSWSFIREKVKTVKKNNTDAERLFREGKSAIILADEEKILLIAGVKDTVKESAPHSIARLHAQGIKTYLISGDNKEVASNLAREVGIAPENVYAEVTPFEKQEVIRKLQEQGEKVAFVGDGINDAIALKQADLSMAMGSGSSVAIETSDVTLIHQDLSAVSHTITISKAVLRNIKLGFFWAFSYNLVAIPIAFLGLLSPVIAAAAMAFSDITVVMNALRLRWMKLEKKGK